MRKACLDADQGLEWAEKVEELAIVVGSITIVRYCLSAAESAACVER